ncbi:hypothetical protein COCOBI_03-5260 [Coccomyxa sp. Obi]|nr:hypothetical protein COCOBI_03-5260 [Coccomyxa sp. Obi]
MGDRAAADGAQEYVLRAPGPEHRVTKYFLGMFPGGDPGLARKKHANWHLQRDEDIDTSRSMMEADRARPWQLMDSPRSVSHRGLPEGGLSGSASSAGYFVLIKEGENFTALPIDDFYTFRPTQKFKVNSLEEAERQMESRQRTIFTGATTSRLAALMAQADEKGGAEGDEAASGSDREEEDEEDFMSRGRRGGAGAGPGPNGLPKGQADEGADVAVDKDGKGEDWEHEEERADDDVDMGDDGEDADGTPTPPKAVRAGSDSDEDRRRAAGISIQGRLKDAGLESESEDEDDDDDEDDLDDEDLDAPVAGLKTDGTAETGRRPTPTPTAAPSTSKQAEPNVESRPTKRKADDAELDGVKKPQESAAGATSAGGVTEQEIVDFLKASGPIASSELTARFKSHFKGTNAEQKKEFTKLVKKVAKLEEVPPGSGNRFIVLRQ